MSRVKHGTVPPLGWHYPAGPKHTAPVLHGQDFDDLVKQLIQYRIDNQRAVGSPQQDIEEYICGNWPHYCWPKDSIVTPTEIGNEPPTRQTLIERVTQWLANRYALSGKLTLVEENEALRRSNICIRCPANKQWRNNCAPCVTSVERTSFLVRQGRSSPLHNRLRACDIAGHDNTAAVFMPPNGLRHAKHYDLPNFCWLNTLPVATKEKSHAR